MITRAQLLAALAGAAFMAAALYALLLVATRDDDRINLEGLAP